MTENLKHEINWILSKLLKIQRNEDLLLYSHEWSIFEKMGLVERFELETYTYRITEKGEQFINDHTD